MDWSSEADAQRRQAVMEEDARQRDADFATYSPRVNNLSFQEKISVRPYEPPSARSFGTLETPSQLAMSSAINDYPLNVKMIKVNCR